MRPSERVAIDAVAGRLDGVGARFGEHVHPVALEHVLDHPRRVGVLARQHLVATGDQGDLGAERAVGARELGAGDTRADHDEVLRGLVELVELGPGEDALAVGLGRRQDPGPGADRDHERVGFDLVEVLGGLAVPGRDDEPLRPVESTVALDDAHTGLDELRLHVLALLAREAQQAGVDRREVHGDLGADGASGLVAGEELHAEVGGLADRVRRLGGRDEGLGRHDVGEHGRSADALALDEGHVGAELGSGEGGFVTAWASPEYCDPLRAFELIGHAAILPHRRAE